MEPAAAKQEAKERRAGLSAWLLPPLTLRRRGALPLASPPLPPGKAPVIAPSALRSRGSFGPSPLFVVGRGVGRVQNVLEIVRRREGVVLKLTHVDTEGILRRSLELFGLTLRHATVHGLALLIVLIVVLLLIVVIESTCIP